MNNVEENNTEPEVQISNLEESIYSTRATKGPSRTDSNEVGGWTR